jgi:hypothetical protein
MIGKSRITFFSYFMFSNLNLSFYLWFGNPDSGTEFIPNSDRLPEKLHVWDQHSIILNYARYELFKGTVSRKVGEVRV